MSMIIEKPLIEDFDRIFELLVELYPDKTDKEKNRELFIEQFNKGREFLVAKEDDKLIGFISLFIRINLQIESKLGLIDELIINKDYKNKGIGSKLIDEITKIAKEKGCKELSTFSNFKREDTHKFYENKGFVKSSYYFWKEI